MASKTREHQGATSAYERDSTPSEAYRAALTALLTTQSVPVWNVGQREMYGEHVMDGPSLDQWVRTANVWAELERNVWEFGNIAAAAGISVTDDHVDGPWTNLLGRITEAENSWLGLVFSLCYLDSIGHAMIRQCAQSNYGPLIRASRLGPNAKWGMVATGLLSLGDVVALDQLPRADVLDARAQWHALCAEVLQIVVAQETSNRWVSEGIAAPIDADQVLAAADARVATRLEAWS
ncbi:MAG: hypothetical protein ABIQ73_03630 [Acidimicrobiales bacterium]